MLKEKARVVTLRDSGTRRKPVRCVPSAANKGWDDFDAMIAEHLASCEQVSWPPAMASRRRTPRRNTGPPHDPPRTEELGERPNPVSVQRVRSNPTTARPGSPWPASCPHSGAQNRGASGPPTPHHRDGDNRYGCDASALTPFRDICLLKAFVRAGIAVTVSENGPLRALTDGNRHLNPLGLCLVPVRADDVSAGSRCIAWCRARGGIGHFSSARMQKMGWSSTTGKAV